MNDIAKQVKTYLFLNVITSLPHINQEFPKKVWARALDKTFEDIKSKSAIHVSLPVMKALNSKSNRSIADIKDMLEPNVSSKSIATKQSIMCSTYEIKTFDKNKTIKVHPLEQNDARDRSCNWTIDSDIFLFYCGFPLKTIFSEIHPQN